MYELRWSDEVSAVVNEEGTIMYAVSSEVGQMIVEYQRLKFMNARQMEVIQEQSVVIGRQVAKITELQSALALHATETANFPTMQEAGSGVPASVSKM